jgi:hypothetical protein
MKKQKIAINDIGSYNPRSKEYEKKKSRQFGMNTVFQDHKVHFSKYFIARALFTIFFYFVGIFFIDMMKIPFSIYGIVSLPFTFIIGYLSEKYYVFQEKR